MAQSLSQIYLHIVFHIDFNTKVEIPEQLQLSLHSYIASACNEHQSPAVIIGGTENHVHALCRLSKTMTVSKLLSQLKIESSKWLKTMAENYNSDLKLFCWQKGYGAFSVSSSQVEVVKKYIANQQEHHKKMTFKQEYIKLLKRYEVDYDERYLWT